jgi:decaprenyl-phosphate phosphoribosyltransferase
MSPWIRLLRPRQWIKNAFVFAPLCFSARFLQGESWKLTLMAALCFLCVSCAVYILNDLHDIEEDRKHPVKKLRPLASGEVDVMPAILMACGFLAIAMYLVTGLPYECALVVLLYVCLNLLYTHVLKHIAIVDIFFVAFCYVLRVLMGGYALQVFISPWIILTTFLLAMFLGFGKRYHEVGFEDYAQVKLNLQHYNRNLLDRLVTISGCAALITYAIYTAESGKPGLVYTVGFVAFGLFRYLQSIYVYNQGGEPETIIFKDRLQLLNLVLWLAVTLWILF